MYGLTIKLAGRQAEMDSLTIRKAQFWTLGFFIFWWGFASILSSTGILYGNVLPPRPVLFLVVPFILFLFFVVKRNSVFKQLFRAIKIETLINVHIFRLIGSWFLIMAYHDLLPSGFALRAGWGDIITGISALLITYFVFKRKTLSINWAYAWNIFGLIDILTVVTTATILTSLAYSNPESAVGVLELTKFPFALIPAFAPASIVFLHVITFQKLNEVRKENQL